MIPAHWLNTESRFRAPLFAIKYRGDTPSVSIVGTDLTLTDTDGDITISMIGKSVAEVVSEIQRLDIPYEAWALFDAQGLSSLAPAIDPTDLTTDGALIVRGDAHIFGASERTRFFLRKPHLVGRHMPWYARVDRGTASVTLDGATWIFSVPEFDRQPWAPGYGKPFVEVVDQPVVKVARTAYQLPTTPVYWRNGNLSLFVDGVRQPSSAVTGVDENNGILYTSKDFGEGEALSVSCICRENSVPYTGVNLNPTEFHNPAILGTHTVLYLLPSFGPTGGVRTSCVFHSTGPSLLSALMAIPKTEEPILLLGAVQVRQPFGSELVGLTDVRVRGGGVREESFDRAVIRNERVLGLNDYGHWDGLPFAGNMSLIATLPNELLDTLGNEEIRAVFEKHASYGAHVILRFV